MLHGVVRQEINWVNHMNESGRAPGWLSMPLVLTSHAWENAKNEQSHQDPSMAELMLGEPSDVSRVLFPADYNTAAAVMHGVYRTCGQFWTLVVPKAPVIPDLFTAAEAAQLLQQGAMRLDWAGYDGPAAQLVLTAIGAYQLGEVVKASVRLAERQVPHSVVYMLEPGRFRTPRSERERAHAAPEALVADLYPDLAEGRLFVTHTRPGPILGALQPLNTGPGRTAALGFINRGGTLTVDGLLFINRSSWAHSVQEAARITGRAEDTLLTAAELDALSGRRSPQGIVF
jgi:phosphoketolase